MVQGLYPWLLEVVGQLLKLDQQVVDRFGFTYLLQMPQFQVNRGLLIAVVERWHSDHNTFHLLMGEMTVTPEDVHRIFRIPTVGDLVYYDQTIDGDAF